MRKETTEQEMAFLRMNIERTLNELNETVYSLYIYPNKAIIPDNMLSQKTLYNILGSNSNYNPGKNVIGKIVIFFNANFCPEITVHDIINRDVFLQKRTRIYKRLDPIYEGMYWIYNFIR